MLTQTWFDCVDDGVGEEKSDIASHITTHTYTPQLCLKCQDHTHKHTKHSVTSGKNWFIFSLCLKTWCFQKWRLTSAYSLIGKHIHSNSSHSKNIKPYWKNVDIKSRCVQWSITTFKRAHSTKSCEHPSNGLRSIHEQSRPTVLPMSSEWQCVSQSIFELDHLFQLFFFIMFAVMEGVFKNREFTW